MDPNFDLTGRLDPVELTGSDKPFVMKAEARAKLERMLKDPRALFEEGRALEAAASHMFQIDFAREETGIAGAAAIINPGIMAAGRIFVPVEKRQVKAAMAKLAEMPYVEAAEIIAEDAYEKKREGAPAEKKKAAALMLLGIQYLESLAPGKDKLLPKLITFLKDMGYVMGDNIPPTLREGAAPTAKPLSLGSAFMTAIREATFVVHELRSAREAQAASRQTLVEQLEKLNGLLQSRRPASVTAPGLKDDAAPT